jgi:hypothetical protein
MNTAPVQGGVKSSGAPRSNNAERGPNCYQCKHFAISWQPSMPYACRLLGFKSKALPAIEVMRIDGRLCQGFQAKPTPAAIGKSVNTLA